MDEPHGDNKMMFVYIFAACALIATVGLIGSSVCRKRRRCKELRAEQKRKALLVRIK